MPKQKKVSYKTLGFDSYEEYLSSSKWRNRKARQLKKQPSCEGCGSESRLLVHHNRYKNLGNETDGDLNTVCHPCHETIHAVLGNSNLRKGTKIILKAILFRMGDAATRKVKIIKHKERRIEKGRRKLSKRKRREIEAVEKGNAAQKKEWKAAKERAETIQEVQSLQKEYLRKV